MATKTIGFIGKNGKRIIHADDCSRDSRYCTCRGKADPPPPIICCCRKDDQGRRWYNLGCRMHTRAWSPEWGTDRLNPGLGISGHMIATTRPGGKGPE